jgi:hypothetical protein
MVMRFADEFFFARFSVQAANMLFVLFTIAGLACEDRLTPIAVALA